MHCKRFDIGEVLVKYQYDRLGTLRLEVILETVLVDVLDVILDVIHEGVLGVVLADVLDFILDVVFRSYPSLMILLFKMVTMCTTCFCFCLFLWLPLVK